MVIFEGKTYDISNLMLPEVCPVCGANILVNNNG